MTEELQYEVADQIAQIRINRPKALNAIHPRIMRPLSDLMKQADADPQVQVIILSGVGAHFGAGYDLKADWGALYGDRSIMGARQMLADCVEFEYCPWDCKKPVIAMVRGYCLAGSCELAMMCCVTFASENARFGEPEIRFSTSPPAVVMPWIVGLKKARELLYTGDIIEADEALRIGMINRVYTDEMLEERNPSLRTPGGVHSTRGVADHQGVYQSRGRNCRYSPGYLLRGRDRRHARRHRHRCLQEVSGSARERRAGGRDSMARESVRGLVVIRKQPSLAAH